LIATPGYEFRLSNVWDGNYYALEVTTRLGLEDSGGMLRVGPVHYNTLEEIERFGEVLALISNAAIRAYG
jgi:selenocysteine lyase/cysteine desulfurase